MSKIHIVGGGTFSHVRNHLALAAPAFGETARRLHHLFIYGSQIQSHEPVVQRINDGQFGVGPDDCELHLTKMANPYSTLETNADVAALIDNLVADETTRVIIMNAALCDYEGQIMRPVTQDEFLNKAHPANTAMIGTESGKHEARLHTSEGARAMALKPAEKLLGRIRKERKDIFLVAFKTTTGATPDEQYLEGLDLLKKNSANLVLANDTVTRHNMIIAPEETRYFETNDREQVLKGLVQMVLARMDNTFTRSTVIGTEEEETVPWDSPLIPDNLREVVNYCIREGAYKPFNGSTAGHFAVRLGPNEILTSKRKRNFNDLDKIGLVRVEYEGKDKVIAHGAKPSVGGQSQRIVFDEHPDLDCIVHFHCPQRHHPNSDAVPVAPQWQNECGSHQCGENTSRHLERMPYRDADKPIYAVMLDGHGPNIVFSRNTPADQVINFIKWNFRLDEKTDGLVEPVKEMVDA